jgi:hypothetical protein
MASAKDCRDNAALCLVLGNETASAEAQNLLFAMARSWTELAARLERNSTLQVHLGEVRIQLN